jgi:flagellin FlaB
MVVARRTRKGETGIGTLVIFISLLLVAATAGTVIITTNGKLQEKSHITGKQTQAQVSTNAKIVEVTGIDGSDGNVEQMTTIYQLAAGSDPINLETMLITESTPSSSASLKLRPGGSTDNEIGQ